MIVKHAVTPLMEAVGKFSGGRVPPILVNSVEYFRDLYDHLSRINSIIEGMRDAIATAIQVSFHKLLWSRILYKNDLLLGLQFLLLQQLLQASGV